MHFLRSMRDTDRSINPVVNDGRLLRENIVYKNKKYNNPDNNNNNYNVAKRPRCRIDERKFIANVSHFVFQLL